MKRFGWLRPLAACLVFVVASGAATPPAGVSADSGPAVHPARQPLADLTQGCPAYYQIQPGYDANLDGYVSIGDIGQITGHWGEQNPTTDLNGQPCGSWTGSDKNGGWIRADVNGDGYVAIGDVGQITGHWGCSCGYVAPLGAPGSVIYVHGVKDPQNADNAWPKLITYAQNTGAVVDQFPYFEDAYQCSSVAIRPFTANIFTGVPVANPMPVSAWPPQGGQQGGQYCDSQGLYTNSRT